MKIDAKHIAILLEAFMMSSYASHNHFVATHGDVLDELGVVNVPHDLDVLGSWHELHENGLAIVHENEDPRTRNDSPYLGQLTPTGLVWCFHYVYADTLGRIKIPGMDVNLCQHLESISRHRLAAIKKL